MGRGIRGLPRHLFDAGYRDQWLEHTFSNQDNHPVCPELILWSVPEEHSLLVEIKSGKNTEAGQLRRYSRVTARDLSQKVGAPSAAVKNHDVVICGANTHATTLAMGLTQSQVSFPLVVKTDSGLSLAANQFSTDMLNTTFTPELPIDWSRVPTGFVPIDAQSEAWEVAEVVIPEILEHMLRRSPQVSVEQICAGVCHLTWGTMGKSGKEQIRANVVKVLQAATQGEFKPYLRVIDRSQPGIRIENNPLEYGSGKRTVTFRRLIELQQSLLNRLRTGADFVPSAPVSLQREFDLEGTPDT